MRIEVQADTFRRALKSTVFAALREPDRRNPAFAGILLDVSPTTFRVVATDGYRLAYFESSDGFDCREPVTVILPAKEIANLKLSRPSNIKIGVGDTEVIIQTGTETFRVSIVQTRYPNYSAVFPSAHGSITLHCDKKQFVEALQSVKKQTTRKNRSVFFWIRPGFIAVAAENANTISPVRIEARSDHSVDGIANCDYLLDAVRVLPAGDVQIRFTPPEPRRPVSSAMELSPTNQSHEIIRQLVMPCWRSAIPRLPGVDS
jgi:DNA polymerase III sliding clamp (beta) subunit (PCNA family)